MGPGPIPLLGVWVQPNGYPEGGFALFFFFWHKASKNPGKHRDLLIVWGVPGSWAFVRQGICARLFGRAPHRAGTVWACLNHWSSVLFGLLPSSAEGITVGWPPMAGPGRGGTADTPYYSRADGALILYDVTALDSFQHVSYWLRKLPPRGSSWGSGRGREGGREGGCQVVCIHACMHVCM